MGQGESVRRATLPLSVVFYAVIGAAWAQTAQDFSRADQLPLPSSGVWQRDTVGSEACFGFNPNDRSVVFQAGGYTIEGLGESAPIELVIVDANTGEHKETVNTVKDEALARAITRSLEFPEESLPDAWGTLSAIARPMDEPPSDNQRQVGYTFYLRHQETGWLKPLIVADVLVPPTWYRPPSAFGEDAVGLVGISRFSTFGALILHFYRLPPDNWANGGSIHIYVSPQVVAQFLNEVGFAYYGAGDFGTALQVFHQAVETDPGHVKAMYNAACSAALLGETVLSLEYLAMLKADGSRGAMDYLAKVDSDTDFNPIRSQSAFQSELRKIRGSGK